MHFYHTFLRISKLENQMQNLHLHKYTNKQDDNTKMHIKSLQIMQKKNI